MLPLYDHNHSRTVPFVTWLLVLLNVLAFFFELSLMVKGEANLDSFINQYGTVPSRLLGEHSAEQILTLFSSMFLHGGWSHILGNMWFLLLFGDNVEDRLGHLKYLFFYLLCGIGADLSQIIFNPHSSVPSIGASGCIAGILGAYVVMFPTAKVVTFNPLMDLGVSGLALTLFRRFLIRVPAFIFLGTWFAFQWLAGSLAFNSYSGEAAHGGVAWWAHIGGFITGLMVIVLPPGPAIIEEHPDSSDPREQLDIPRSWNVRDDQLPDKSQEQGDYVTPDWFWKVMVTIAVIWTSVLLYQISQYKRHIGDWKSPPVVESVATFNGFNNRFMRSEDLLNACKSPSVKLNRLSSLWFLNDSSATRKTIPARATKEVKPVRLAKAPNHPKQSKAKKKVATIRPMPLPIYAAQLDLADPSRPATYLLNPKSKEPLSLFGSAGGRKQEKVLDAALVDEQLYVFVVSSPAKASQEDFDQQIDLIKVENPAESPEKWRTTRKTIRTIGIVDTFGESCVYMDNYLYVFGTNSGSAHTGFGKQVFVARIDKKNLSAMNLSALTYLTTLDGSPLWSKNKNYAKPTFLCDAVTSLNVRRAEGCAGVFAFYTSANDQHIYVRHGILPEGPWSGEVRLPNILLGQSGATISVHPEFADKAGQTVITFNRQLPTSGKHKSPAAPLTAGMLSIRLSAR
jgi:membrane associated rhomboid family serine protease